MNVNDEAPLNLFLSLKLTRNRRRPVSTVAFFAPSRLCRHGVHRLSATWETNSHALQRGLSGCDLGFLS